MLAVHVGHEDDPAGLGVLPLAHVVAAHLFVLLVQREAARIHQPSADVHLALHHVEDRHLLVGEEDRPEGVDVGQLVARRVDREEVGVAHAELAGRVTALQHPRGQLRLHVRLRRRRRDAGVEVSDPVFEPLLLGHLLSLLVEVGVELLGVVHRRVDVTLPSAVEVQQRSQEGRRQRRREGHAQRVVVHRLPLGQLAVQRPADALAGNIRILPHVVEYPHEVGGGERHAVRPLHAFAQVEGEHGAVVGQFVPLGAVRDDLVQGRVGAEQERLGAAEHVAVVGRTGARHAQLAAVLAYLRIGLQHHRIVGQTILYRGQIAGLHHGGQHRRLLEGGDAHLRRRRRVEPALPDGIAADHLDDVAAGRGHGGSGAARGPFLLAAGEQRGRRHCDAQHQAGKQKQSAFHSIPPRGYGGGRLAHIYGEHNRLSAPHPRIRLHRLRQPLGARLACTTC